MAFLLSLACNAHALLSLTIREPSTCFGKSQFESRPSPLGCELSNMAMKEPVGASKGIRSLAFSKDGQLLASCSDDQTDVAGARRGSSEGEHDRASRIWRR